MVITDSNATEHCFLCGHFIDGAFIRWYGRTYILELHPYCAQRLAASLRRNVFRLDEMHQAPTGQTK